MEVMGLADSEEDTLETHVVEAISATHVQEALAVATSATHVLEASVVAMVTTDLEAAMLEALMVVSVVPAEAMLEVAVGVMLEVAVEAFLEVAVEDIVVEVAVEDTTHQTITRTATTHTTVKTTSTANRTNVSDHRLRMDLNNTVIFKTVTSATLAMKLLSLLNVALSEKTMQNSEEMFVKIYQRSESMLLKTSQI